MARSRPSTSARIGAFRWPTFPPTATSSPGVLAVALDVGNTAIRIGLQPERDKSGAVVADRQTGAVTLEGAALDGPRAQEPGQARRRLLRRTDCRPRRRISPASDSRKCPAPASPWIRSPAACWRWSAASRSTNSARPRARFGQRPRRTAIQVNRAVRAPSGPGVDEATLFTSYSVAILSS